MIVVDSSPCQITKQCEYIKRKPKIIDWSYYYRICEEKCWTTVPYLLLKVLQEMSQTGLSQHQYLSNELIKRTKRMLLARDGYSIVYRYVLNQMGLEPGSVQRNICK